MPRGIRALPTDALFAGKRHKACYAEEMATHELNTPVERCAVPLTSIQPGGGYCMGLELAWGRFRRDLLRRFRPGYVRAMLARRQGHCENCLHDIIDPRDL